MKVFLFLALGTILFNGAEQFEQFFLESYRRNLPVKLFQNLCTDLAEEVVKSFFSIHSPGGHFVQPSQTI